MWQPLVVTGEALGAEMGTGRVKVKADAGAVQVHRMRGLAVGSLFHCMQTLTHTRKELKNTLNHKVSVPPSPPETQKDTWLIREPPPWNKDGGSESLHPGTRQQCGPG